MADRQSWLLTRSRQSLGLRALLRRFRTACRIQRSKKSAGAPAQSKTLRGILCHKSLGS